MIEKQLPEAPGTPLLSPPKEEIPPPPPPRRRRWLWLLLLIGLVLIAAYFLWPKHQAESPGGAENGGGGGHRGRGGPAGPAPVVAVRAQKGNIGVYLTGLGNVTPIYTVTIKTRVDGQLMQVFYKEGDVVRQGAPLAQIDPRPYQVQLTQAEGALLKSQKPLLRALIRQLGSQSR